jgi:hypothetical protein
MATKMAQGADSYFTFELAVSAAGDVLPLPAVERRAARALAQRLFAPGGRSMLEVIHSALQRSLGVLCVIKKTNCVIKRASLCLKSNDILYI